MPSLPRQRCQYGARQQWATGDRVFVDPDAGGKEARDEVAAGAGARGQDDSPGLYLAKAREIRTRRPDRCLRLQLHQIVEAVALDAYRNHAQCLEQVRWRDGRNRWLALGKSSSIRPSIAPRAAVVRPRRERG